jgi:hypothetical protein
MVVTSEYQDNSFFWQTQPSMTWSLSQASHSKNQFSYILPSSLSRLHPIFDVSLLEPYSDPSQFHPHANPEPFQLSDKNFNDFALHIHSILEFVSRSLQQPVPNTSTLPSSPLLIQYLLFSFFKKSMFILHWGYALC